jgi:bifunctional DNA-binding transcriptional regulator/antitoxin component of YhaV-PrlF toxin-antitoxin module
MTSDFNYKKYSLENLENWMYDAMSSAEATPQEIYDVIKGVVEENYYTYKHQASQAYELLALLNGNGKGHLTCDKDDPSPECKGSWNSFWEENYYPDEYKGSTVSSVSDNMPPWGHSDLEALSQQKEDKVIKWQLPVDKIENGDTGEEEYFITFPDDLLERANLNPGDEVEWHDQGDGSFKLIKKEKKEQPSWVRGNELAKVKTYQEMIDDGWIMTDDGFWVKE